MQAMVLEKIGAPLRLVERPEPQPGPGQIRVRVEACGVCRTDLHVVDGELPDIPLPIVALNRAVIVLTVLAGLLLDWPILTTLLFVVLLGAVLLGPGGSLVFQVGRRVFARQVALAVETGQTEPAILMRFNNSIAVVMLGLAQVAFLADLVRIPSQRGEEHAAQSFMAAAYEADGYAVDMWRVDIEAIRDLPGFSPVAVSYDDAFNVVASHTPRNATGRSLILEVEADERPDGISLRLIKAEPIDGATERLGRQLTVFPASENALTAIKAQLKPGGEGAVTMIVSRDGGAREYEIKLPGGFKLTAEVAGGIKALAGVVDVRLN